MKIGKLLELEAGATLPLGLTSGDPVTVNVSGVTLYTATHGARKEHKAVRVIDTIENTDATRELETAPFTPAGALG